MQESWQNSHSACLQELNSTSEAEQGDTQQHTSRGGGGGGVMCLHA